MILPVLLVIQHIIHMKFQPRRIMIIVSVLLPAVFFAAVGGVYLRKGAP